MGVEVEELQAVAHAHYAAASARDESVDHLFAGWVQGGSGLVQEGQGRLVEQQARERDALLLACGQC
jgi:hypothetical protein